MDFSNLDLKKRLNFQQNGDTEQKRNLRDLWVSRRDTFMGSFLRDIRCPAGTYGMYGMVPEKQMISFFLALWGVQYGPLPFTGAGQQVLVSSTNGKLSDC